MQCNYPACNAQFVDPAGHSTCRSHSFCAYSIGGVKVWHPDECTVCFGWWLRLSLRELSQEEKTKAKQVLYSWVAGFSRNSQGKPYLLTEGTRAILFPSAPLHAVVSKTDAAPTLEQIQNNTFEAIPDQLGNVDLGLDRMEDVQGKQEVSGTTTFRAKVLSAAKSSSFSEEPFKGFTPRSDATPSVRPKTKGSSSSSSSSRKKKQENRDADHNPHPSEIPLPPESKPALAPPQPTIDLAALQESILRAFRTELSSVKESVTNLGNKHQALANQVSAISSGPAPVQSNQAPGPAHRQLPPASVLPPFDSSNPWRSALHSILRDGMLTVEGFGTRPFSDFETFPQGQALPYCWVRLHPAATVREDRVPKETVILPRDRAQSCFMAETRGLVENTQLTPESGNLVMFLTDRDMPTPFATKILEHALKQAVTLDKKGPALKEEERTSLLLPNDSDVWRDVHRTFTVGKFSQDCASMQFKEDLPRLPKEALNREFEARSRLERTLHSFTLVEFGTMKDPDADFLKVIAKSMLTSLHHDLSDFILARRGLRAHVLKNARVRHEPQRLIDGHIWGDQLFPQSLVDKALQEAAKACMPLKDRWGLSFKRKMNDTESLSSQSSRGKGSGNQRYKIPKRSSHQNPQQVQVLPVPASGQSVQLPPGVQYVVTGPQSPAFNQSFHEQGQIRNQGYSNQARGRRGGTHHGRGRGNQRRGRGGQHKGAGPSPGKTQNQQ